jgi:hypothetical protein
LVVGSEVSAIVVVAVEAVAVVVFEYIHWIDY